MWDDMFPLEGGGLVHLKLQFLLTDAERQRIQTMERILPPEIGYSIIYSRSLLNIKLICSISSSFMHTCSREQLH